MKQIAIVALLALATLTQGVSAATGSTVEKTCQTGLACGGGPTRAFNYTTNAWEMFPQCFPWVWRTDYLNGNIVALYENQRICRENRARDFRF